MTIARVESDDIRHAPEVYSYGSPVADGRRTVFGGANKFHRDPHWRDYLLFYEYFHGDNGAGLGASHQSGWTGCIARVMQLFNVLTPSDIIGADRAKQFRRVGHGPPTATAAP
jgi:hypothetical protein